LSAVSEQRVFLKTFRVVDDRPDVNMPAEMVEANIQMVSSTLHICLRGAVARG